MAVLGLGVGWRVPGPKGTKNKSDAEDSERENWDSEQRNWENPGRAMSSEEEDGTGTQGMKRDCPAGS